MSTIQVSCTDQVLTLNNKPVIASGGIKEDYISVDFCALWTGFTKTAVFWHGDDTDNAYPVILDEAGSGEIPWEVLTDSGTISFGIYGVDGTGARRTSEILKYKIKQGAFLETATPSTPTPEIWEQLEAQCAEAIAKVADKANKVTGGTAGNFAALSSDGDLVDSGKKPVDFQAKLTFDETPTAGSTNPVTSGGVNTALSNIQTELSKTVTVSKGGTGATTASDARTNLGITPANIGALAASQVVAVYNTAVEFNAGKATYTNSAITANSVVIVERRVGTAGSANVQAFGTTSNDGSVTICASFDSSASLNLNILIINP